MQRGCLGILGCWLATVTIASGGVTLVEEGRARAVIVLPPEPEPGERRAAEELVEHVELLSGAQLDVVAVGADTGGRLPILVGRAANDDLVDLVMARQKELRPHWHIEDRIAAGGDTGAFALWVDDRAIQLRGGMGAAGTLTAACELLEQLGVRWFMPGKYGLYLPEATTLTLAEQQTIQIPSFVFRRAPQRVRGDPDFAHRARGGGLGSQPGRHGFPKPDGKTHRELRREHPEYYALKPDGTRGGRQLCVSNPDVLALVVKAIRQQLEAADAPTDTRRIVSVGPHDGGGHCLCEACRALDAPAHRTTPFSGPPTPSTTDRYVWFINRILEELEPNYPNLRLGFYAYADYELPPVNVNPSGRLAISLAPIRQCRHHGPNNPVCPESNYVLWLLEQWKPHAVEIWDRGYIYNLACPGLPISMVHRLREELPRFYEQGVIGTAPSYAGTFATYNPGPYIRNRLAWNHEADVDALLSEFYAKFYGAAATPMEQYHSLIDQAHRDGNFHAGASWAIPDFYPPELRNRLRELLEQAAMAVADDPDDAIRVRITRTGFDYLEAYCELRDDRNRLDFVAEMKALERMRALRDSLLEDFDATLLDPYQARFLERFIAGVTESGYAIATSGAKIVAALRPEWDFYLDTEAWGRYMQLQRPESRGGYWQTIRTDKTWSEQGLHHYFGQSWYRQRLPLPRAVEGREVRLWFAGVNRTADVWVNGHFVGANHDGTAFDLGAHGAAFKPFEFDVTRAIRPGEENVVVVRTFRDTAGELGMGGLVGPTMFYVPGDNPTGAE